MSGKTRSPPSLPTPTGDVTSYTLTLLMEAQLLYNSFIFLFFTLMDSYIIFAKQQMIQSLLPLYTTTYQVLARKKSPRLIVTIVKIRTFIFCLSRRSQLLPNFSENKNQFPARTISIHPKPSSACLPSSYPPPPHRLPAAAPGCRSCRSRTEGMLRALVGHCRATP